MPEILNWLNHAITGPPAVALLGALVWGVFSVLFSPCHLASIPLIVGFVNGQGSMSVRRAFALSAVFSLGILATIAGIGTLTAAAGRLLGDLGPWANYLVAGVFFLVGLHLVGVIPMPWSGPGMAGYKRKGMWAALILGLVFGVALGPCTFAFMAPLLVLTFKLAGARPLLAMLLLAAYGVGHCAVIVAAGTFTEVVQRYLNWNERSKAGVALRAGCGGLVLLGGVYLIYTAA